MYPDYMWDMIDSHTAMERTRADKAEKRAAELEAKLAKVREWELLNNGIHNAAWRDLVEILDGEL